MVETWLDHAAEHNPGESAIHTPQIVSSWKTCVLVAQSSYVGLGRTVGVWRVVQEVNTVFGNVDHTSREVPLLSERQLLLLWQCLQ